MLLQSFDFFTTNINRNTIYQEDFSTTNTIQITPFREIKNGYWLTEFKSKKFKHNGILYLKNRNNTHLPILECSHNSLHVYNAPLQLTRYSKTVVHCHLKGCKIKEKKSNRRKVFRNFILRLLIKGGISDTPVAVSMGLIFGDTSYLDKSFRKKAQEGGILHLFAASGLHIGILMGTIYFLLQFFRVKGYYITKLIPVSICFFYLYLLNFPISLVRAYIFALLIVFSSCFFRKINAADLLVYTSAIILFLLQEEYFTISFLLSFGAVASIFIIKPFLDTILKSDKKRFLVENITLSLTASWGTFPILVYFFSSFSFGSVLVNLLLIPMAGITLPMLYVSLFLEGIHFTFISSLFWTVTELLIRILLFLADFMSKHFGYYRTVEENKSLYLILYIIILLLLLITYFIHKYTLNKNFLRFFAPAIVLCLSISFYVVGFKMTFTHSQSDQLLFTKTSFLLLKSDKLFLGGNCKYYNYSLKQNLFKLCNHTITSIYIEDENCLKYIFKCKLPSELKAIETSNQSLREWEKRLQIPFHYRGAAIEFELRKQKLILFHPIRDSLDQLIAKTKNGKGKVILFFPPGSKDNAENWNKYSKYLGISSDWIFISAYGKQISLL